MHLHHILHFIVPTSRHGRPLANPQSADNKVDIHFDCSSFKRDPAAKIYLGTCKWYNSQRGFGFVVPDNLVPDLGDVFVHHTVILSKGFRSLNSGERLECTVSGLRVCVCVSVG